MIPSYEKHRLPRLTDSHCHLTCQELSKDIDGVLSRAREAGLVRLLTVGQGLEDCLAAVELADRFPQVHVSVGFGPHGAERAAPDAMAKLTDLAGKPKVVALGEAGLDYYYDRPAREVQQSVFAQQVDLAAGLKLPLIIHCRDAWDDCLAILDQARPRCPAGVFHCYTGPPELVPQLIDHGFYISLSGMVTFKNAHACRDAARLIPRDRLLIETDAPYMSPEPVRKIRPNEPALLVHTAGFLADFLDIPPAELTELTTSNARDLFGW